MNRAARRAARFTKAGRRQHAINTEHICEHGNWMKTDGRGEPMCPHGCGFRPEDRDYQAQRARTAAGRSSTPGSDPANGRRPRAALRLAVKLAPVLMH